MYCYYDERPHIFTDEGQREFLQVRDEAHKLLQKAGAFRMFKPAQNAGLTGDSWMLMAYVDRMMEMGEIREVTGPEEPGQSRVFVKF